MSMLENRIDRSVGAETAELTADALMALLSGANAGLAVFDQDLCLTFANDQYIELCGYSPEEAHKGRKWRPGKA